MDFIVPSHLRWNFVFQRPQQLMTRCARNRRVFFWEEPYFDSDFPKMEVESHSSGVQVVTPHLPRSSQRNAENANQEKLLQELIHDFSIREGVLWYYTPMAVNFTRKLKPRVVVYDCMDELSAFRGAHPSLPIAENQLFAKADLVFTGGQSLYESKRYKHADVHCFPSSIDKHFFMSAREITIEPADQAKLPRPRLGYCGVIDERIDLELLANIADSRPEWQIVMIGPVVKISTADLPIRSNIHYLGAKPYAALPSYFAGWDIGLLPFARNESTRFISPTKTPEYLAAGLPAVSTSITDVITPYGTKELVHIANDSPGFIQAIEAAMPTRHSPERMKKADAFLATTSWDETWSQMYNLVVQAAAKKVNYKSIPSAAADKLAAAN